MCVCVQHARARVRAAQDGTAGQKEDAAAALANLALDTENKSAIREAGGIGPLVALTRDGSTVRCASLRVV